MMRWCLLTASALLLAVGGQARELTEEHADKPWFCHGLDCPKFKVLNTTETYEIREYEATKWATTQVDSLLYSVAITEGFKRLFDYISGKNNADKKIPMTSPVTVNVRPGDGPFCKSHYIVNFFVPPKYQEDTPKPTDSKVYLSSVRAGYKVAVLQFGGFLVDDFTLSSKAATLKEALELHKINYDNRSYFSVGYDPPTRLQHRHNEVWILLDAPDSELEITQ